MSEFAVVVFPDERKAREGLLALEMLHEDGSVTLYASAIVARHADGTLSVITRTEPGAIASGVSALVGALIGQFAGTAGAAVAVTTGGLFRGGRDCFHAEVSDEFLASVERALAPGKLALVAEISEEWVTPLDLRMKALGGKAVRAWRQDSAEEFFEKHADAWKAQLQERGAERAAAKVARTKSGLDAEIARAEEAVRKSAATALKRLDDTRVELRARLAALAEQSRTATPAVRSRIDQRMAELRADFGEREKTLLRAYASGEDAVGGEGTSRVESVHE